MSAEVRSEPRSVPSVRARVLLIDDSRFIRRLFGYVFEDLGFFVQTAENAREGIRMATEDLFDVVVVDGVLPDMDGRDVCRHIASLPGEKPIIVMFTGSNRMYQERHAAFRDGVDACMKKDTTGQLLVARVEELLAIRDLERMAQPA